MSGETPTVVPGAPSVELRIRGEELSDGMTVLVVENPGSRPVQLSFGVEIEALEIPSLSDNVAVSEYSIGAEWFFLIADCSEPIEQGLRSERCVTLEAGAVLRTVPWTGYNASVQCPRGQTPSDFPSPVGIYRFVLRSCDGVSSFLGEPFWHRSRAAELIGDF